MLIIFTSWLKTAFSTMKQNSLDHILVTSHVQHLLHSSIQCQYSQTIVVITTVTAQLSLLDCLPPPFTDCSEWTGIYTDIGF